MLEFKTTIGDCKLIALIAKRAHNANPAIDYERTTMDLGAAHSNGCPLDFQKLFDFPAGDFNHDFYGIFSNINRQTGELENGFVPRCAMDDTPAEGFVTKDGIYQDVTETLAQEWRTDEDDTDDVRAVNPEQPY